MTENKSTNNTRNIFIIIGLVLMLVLCCCCGCILSTITNPTFQNDFKESFCESLEEDGYTYLDVYQFCK